MVKSFVSGADSPNPHGRFDRGIPIVREWSNGALLFRAKAAVAVRGISLRAWVSEALTEKLSSPVRKEKPWMKEFGALRHLHDENVRIDRIIEEEFGQIDPEDWK